jgi:pimeloyl-ACP methyl ester carboxylesterase
MDAGEPQFLDVGDGKLRRRLAYRLEEGKRGARLGLIWLPGFLSDMDSTKALAIAAWARAQEMPMLRFDYSGHGLSEGDLEEASIGDWLAETSLMLERLLGRAERAIAIGSSMGGWIALLLARKLAQEGALGRLAGLVLIAPAWDMTEALMWEHMSAEAKATLARDGVYYEPSLYGDPYPITARLIEEGRTHLIGKDPLALDLPVRILQGMRDPDVPWRHALELVDKLRSNDVELTLIKDGEHRLSREEDLRRLESAVAGLAARASPAP